MAKLGDVFSLQITGEWGSECDTNHAGTKILRTTNFTSNGTIDYSNIAVRKIAESKIEKKRLKKGDIILEKSGGTEKTPVGRVVFCDKAIENDIYLCNNFTQAMRVNPAVAYPRYVFYFMWYLHYSGKTDLLQNKTTGIRNLRVKSYLDEKIPLPSLDEQRRIAAVLDKVTALIAQRRAQLDKLDLLVKSRFVEMFGAPIRNERNWPMVEIGDIAEIRIGPFGSLLHKEDYIKGGHALVNPSHIIDSQICVDENLTVSDEKYAELEPYHLKINDIVLGRRGEMGRCAVVHEEGLLCGTGSLIIRPKKEMKPYFLQSIISNPAYKKIIEDKSVGVTMMNLNVPIVSKLTVPKLPLPLQEQFIGILEKVNELKQPLTNSLQEQEILKNSLMQKYFE